MSVRGHRRSIPDSGSCGFLVELVAAGGGRYWSEGSRVSVAGLMADCTSRFLSSHFLVHMHLLLLLLLPLLLLLLCLLCLLVLSLLL